MASDLDRTAALIGGLRSSAEIIKEIATEAIEKRDVELLIMVVRELIDSVDSLVSLSGLAAAALAIEKNHEAFRNPAVP